MKEPLAFKLRPTKLDDVLGQQHLTGEGMLLRNCVDQKRLFSMIFYGPPGCGKTTLAVALASELHLPYRMFNAVTVNKTLVVVRMTAPLEYRNVYKNTVYPKFRETVKFTR